VSGKPIRWLQIPKYGSPVHTINLDTGYSWCQFENNYRHNCLPIRLRRLEPHDRLCVNCESLKARATPPPSHTGENR
jgi:hypothetical protein